MGLGQYFDKTAEEYIEMLLSPHPSLAGITLETLKEGPMKPKPYGAPPLLTPSGRIEFYVEKMKEFGEELPRYIDPLELDGPALAEKYPLLFFSTHAKHREHGTLCNMDWIREFEPEPVLDMNPVDAEKRSIREGDMVVAFNDRGSVKLKTVVHEGVRPGVVSMTEGWWPRDFAGGSHQELTGTAISPAQEAAHESMAQMQALPVEVKRAEEE
jgi:anaerobic selenocysteine-containing dehydrogenase